MTTTWADMAGESLDGAKLLNEHQRDRSAINRAYFSAYSALSGELTKAGVQGAAGRPNPSHAQLAMLARHNLDHDRYNETSRRRIASSVRLLLALRVAADYDPASGVGQEEAVLALREAGAIRKAVAS